MDILFSLDYQAEPGQTLCLNMPGMGGALKVCDMTTADRRHWTCRLQADGGCCSLDYFFSVCRDGCEERREWTTVTHRLDLDAAAATTYAVSCRWHERPADSYLYSSAFTDCVNPHPADRPAVIGVAARAPHGMVRLTVRAPQLRAGMRLVLVGEAAALGGWQASEGRPMWEHHHNEWITDVDADDLGHSEFKFVAITAQGDVLWETGPNRRSAAVSAATAGTTAVDEQDQAFFALADDHLAGTLVPVFSLRTKGSCGIGDFGDLQHMTDLAAATGQRVLQVLPINDTTSDHTWHDSYPYSCISVFALHPQYADLRQLPPLSSAAEREAFERLRRELNDLPEVDCVRVNEAKTRYLRSVYADHGRAVLDTAAFRQFFADNAHWLVPYGHYCHLRDTYGHNDLSRWPGHERWHEADRQALSDRRTRQWRDVAFYYYVQFVLFEQMQAAHRHARACGVVLKGDIPIGVNRNGCDVWHEPDYFCLDAQAGAPPDAFSVNGQNWGFPTYNWQRMATDGYRWWVRRFTHMARFFDAYRIDHVLGFFRIWAIPTTCVHGLLGQFAPALPLTPADIEASGFHFDAALHTTPHITRAVLDDLFGPQADSIIAQCLTPVAPHRYALRPAYATERHIADAFAGRHTADDVALRDALYRLVSDVLFVADATDASRYHPRITAHSTYAYAALGEADRQAFDRLYDDFYYRRHNRFWHEEAMRKLPTLVEATRMLVCAEDLGMVPACVPDVMAELRILSLELQQMPKTYGLAFGRLADNPYRSVCTFSTHDMAPLRQWWDEDEARAQRYYHEVLHREGPAPHPLPAALAADIVRLQLQCPSMLCVLLLQDWLAVSDRLRLADGDAERINIPADPHHYWRYRMHLNIEDLLADADFCRTISTLVADGGRLAPGQ